MIKKLKNYVQKKYQKKKKLKKLLFGCPQKKVICLDIGVLSPKKPNSAKRAIAEVIISKIIKKGQKFQFNTAVFIPGIRHDLKKNQLALMRGGRTQDLPKMKYKLIRGVLQLGGCLSMHNARSKYGAIKHFFFIFLKSKVIFFPF